MIVDDKVVSWALGVIALELLLERPAFGMFQGKNDVRFNITVVLVAPERKFKKCAALQA